MKCVKAKNNFLLYQEIIKMHKGYEVCRKRKGCKHMKRYSLSLALKKCKSKLARIDVCDATWAAGVHGVGAVPHSTEWVLSHTATGHAEILLFQLTAVKNYSALTLLLKVLLLGICPKSSIPTSV